MSWLCSCGCRNFSCNTYCPASLTRNFYRGEHIQISPATYDWTLYALAEGRVNKLLMTPNEELHAKFFNEESALVVTMNDADLEEHIHELESIAREAKARILSAVTEKNNRRAKSGNKAWRVEPIGPDPTVTDSINKVKQRSSRMSKLDKMRNKMAELGIPDSELDQMLAKMVAQARKEPEALRAEQKLKGDMKEPTLPTIVTEEEKIARIERRKELDKEDKAIEQAEKEKALAEAQKKKEIQPITGILDPSTLKFT